MAARFAHRSAQLIENVAFPEPLLQTALALFADPGRRYEEQKESVNEIFTRAYLKKLMEAANGNQSLAARIAGLDRTYLGRLLLKYGMR